VDSFTRPELFVERDADVGALPMDVDRESVGELLSDRLPSPSASDEEAGEDERPPRISTNPPPCDSSSEEDEPPPVEVKKEKPG
jgi:hypothetical protein